MNYSEFRALSLIGEAIAAVMDAKDLTGNGLTDDDLGEALKRLETAHHRCARDSQTELQEFLGNPMEDA